MNSPDVVVPNRSPSGNVSAESGHPATQAMRGASQSARLPSAAASFAGWLCRIDARCWRIFGSSRADQFRKNARCREGGTWKGLAWGNYIVSKCCPKLAVAASLVNKAAYSPSMDFMIPNSTDERRRKSPAHFARPRRLKSTISATRL